VLPSCPRGSRPLDSTVFGERPGAREVTFTDAILPCPCSRVQRRRERSVRIRKCVMRTAGVVGLLFRCRHRIGGSVAHRTSSIRELSSRGTRRRQVRRPAAVGHGDPASIGAHSAVPVIVRCCWSGARKGQAALLSVRAPRDLRIGSEVCVPVVGLRNTGCPVLPPSARDRGLGFREAAKVAGRARLGRASHWDVCRDLPKEDAAHVPPVEPPGKSPARRRTPTQGDSDGSGSRGCSWQRTRKTPGTRRPRREASARWFRRHLYEGPCDERAPDSRRRCTRWAPSAMGHRTAVSAREGPLFPRTEASPKGCDRKENAETLRLELR